MTVQTKYLAAEANSEKKKISSEGSGMIQYVKDCIKAQQDRN